MKNFTISLGIGLNMFFTEYYTTYEPEVERSWSVRFKRTIGLRGVVR